MKCPYNRKSETHVQRGMQRHAAKVKQDFCDRSADLALRKKGEVLDVSGQGAKELTAKATGRFIR